MDRAAHTTTSFATWYRAELRPALHRASPAIVEHFEKGMTKDGPSLALPVLVLGVAGVGKSTLLNTLLSDRLPLLPQGGVGSFTSAPVRVVFSSEPYLAIRRGNTRSFCTTLLTALTSASPATRVVQQARVLVCGSQFEAESADYLTRALRAAMTGRVVDDLRPRDRERLTALVEILTNDHQGWIVIDAGARLPELRRDLELNAAGFLSPLVAEIELGWNASFLASGVQLVDLPGLGVAHDIHQQQSQDLFSQAVASLVVVDRSGITEVCARALLPLLRNLQESSDESWGQLVVAVTHLDQIARDQRASEPRDQRASWQSHFDQLGTAAQGLIHGQLAQQFARVGLGGSSQRSTRARFASSVRVMPVAPLEHRRLHVRDPDDPAVCTDEVGAGITRLRQVIHSLGATWIERLILGLSELTETNRRVQTIVGPALREMAHLLANGTFTSW